MRTLTAPEYVVYIRKVIKGATSIPLVIKAHSSDQAKLGAQMVMRKRFGMELNRDYEITKTIKKNNPKR